jgi:hypothetical protein
MAGGLTRTTFNRSDLVRILSEVAPDPGVPKYDLGERLGQWLDVMDALALFSALNSGTGATSVVPVEPDSAAKRLRAQSSRVRQQLSEAIINDGVFGTAPPRIRFPTPLPEATVESALDFTPYHRYYLAHQRDMSTAISALRVNARKALAKVSPALGQLAEIDAIFENALTQRERNLLATIPMLLAKRFTQRYQEHQAAQPEAATDTPSQWAQPGGWLEAFCRDAQSVLLAELELRLSPVEGLIAALDERDPPRITEQ